MLSVEKRHSGRPSYGRGASRAFDADIGRVGGGYEMSLYYPADDAVLRGEPPTGRTG
jgi:hypothetical protein